jgi:plasmid replication initiation protein
MRPDRPVTVPARRRATSRTILLDRTIETLPVFRLSDSAEDLVLTYQPAGGGRWRVLPASGERLPGTFDQDVYVELMHRFHDAGAPADGVLTFTLHDFLRSMGRRADGRTYELLRSALGRLERTRLESQQACWDAAANAPFDGWFTVLTSVTIDRRRTADREQMSLFPSITAGEPGDARVTLAPLLRANLAAGHVSVVAALPYRSLHSPVARRLYRLLEAWRAEGRLAVRLPLEAIAELLPLQQRYPSHLQRVLQPAHEMLVTAGLARRAAFVQDHKQWFVEYESSPRGTLSAAGGLE